MHLRSKSGMSTINKKNHISHKLIMSISRNNEIPISLLIIVRSHSRLILFTLEGHMCSANALVVNTLTPNPILPAFHLNW